MSIHRRNLPTGVSPDDEAPKTEAPKAKRQEKDPVAAEREYLDELRPKKTRL